MQRAHTSAYLNTFGPIVDRNSWYFDMDLTNSIERCAKCRVWLLNGSGICLKYIEGLAVTVSLDHESFGNATKTYQQ